jgi:hypothetical protein
MKQQYKIMITLFIVLSVITALVFAVIESPEAAIRRKMEGLWNIELESSTVYDNRECNCCTLLYDETYMCSGIISVGITSKDMIRLPCGNGNMEDNTGVWKVISTNPDSVFFNVPENPFHGKYAVRFYIDNNGWVYRNMPHNIYKMELKNDSMLLICNKSGNTFGNDFRDWESRSDWK